MEFQKKITALSLFTLTFLFYADTTQASCWKQSYGRGVGMPTTGCANGEEQSGALCYPQCNSGYIGVGPVCWQSCPDGYQDTGAECLKPSAYGRGAGYVLWQRGKCEDDNGRSCEKNGALWYPTCKDGFHSVGCCICSPDCPAGMSDMGVSCQKKSYGRGAGSVLQNNIKECKPGYKGFGPVCWQSCPNGYQECGALCTDQGQCFSDVMNIQVGEAVFLDSANGVNTLIVAKQIGTAALNLANQLCEENTASAFYYDVDSESYPSQVYSSYYDNGHSSHHDSHTHGGYSSYQSQQSGHSHHGDYTTQQSSSHYYPEVQDYHYIEDHQRTHHQNIDFY